MISDEFHRASSPINGPPTRSTPLVGSIRHLTSSIIERKPFRVDRVHIIEPGDFRIGAGQEADHPMSWRPSLGAWPEDGQHPLPRLGTAGDGSWTSSPGATVTRSVRSRWSDRRTAHSAASRPTSGRAISMDTVSMAKGRSPTRRRDTSPKASAALRRSSILARSRGPTGPGRELPAKISLSTNCTSGLSRPREHSPGPPPDCPSWPGSV